MARLNGPRLAPTKGPATHLVVLCHGYGANGDDLISLAAHWQRSVTGAAFVAPNAPERCPVSNGYQWFALNRMDIHEVSRGTASAAPLLESFIEAELKRLELPPERLALAGFSQGAMMALHVGLRRKTAPVAIVGFSGLFVASEKISTAREGAPPIFLAHGDADTTIPAAAMFQSAIGLGAEGVPVLWHLSRGMGHGIDADSLALASRFLADAFNGAWAQAATPLSCVLTRV